MKLSIRFEESAGENLAIVEPADALPRAQVVFVHGLSEHIGRPLHFARRLGRLGYRTIIPELLGHGAPASTRRDASWVYDGYRATESAGETISAILRRPGNQTSLLRRIKDLQYEALRIADARSHVRQIDRTLELSRKLGPGLPLFLAGHSMGGMLSLEAAWQRSNRGQSDLAGVLLLSPALDPTPPRGKPLEKLFLGAAWSLRKLPVSPARTAFKGLLNLNLPIETTSGNRWVSDLLDEVALYASDPLVPHRLPTRYVSSIESQMAVTDRRGSGFPVPGLVIVPEVDGITNPAAASRFVRSVQRAMGSDAMRLARIEGLCAHDLLRSSAQHRVVEIIGSWLEERLSATVSPGLAGRLIPRCPETPVTDAVAGKAVS